MADEFHELFAASFIRGFNQDRPNRVDTEGLPVLLLFLNEVVVSAKLLEHVGHHHTASVSLVAKVNEQVAHRAVCKSQAEQRIRLDRHAFGFVSLLPEDLAALP